MANSNPQRLVLKIRPSYALKAPPVIPADESPNVEGKPTKYLSTTAGYINICDKHSSDIGSDCDKLFVNDVSNGSDKHLMNDIATDCDKRLANDADDQCHSGEAEKCMVVNEAKATELVYSRRRPILENLQVVSFRASPSVTNRFLFVAEEDKGGGKKCRVPRMGTIPQRQRPLRLFRLRPHDELGNFTLQSLACGSYIAVDSCSECSITLMSSPLAEQSPTCLFKLEPSATYNIVFIKSTFCSDQYVSYGDSNPSNVCLCKEGREFEMHKEREITDEKIKGLECCGRICLP